MEGILVAPTGTTVEPSLKIFECKKYLYIRSEVLKIILEVTVKCKKPRETLKSILWID